MKKLNNTPIDANDIKEYLNTQDSFQLEMDILNICKLHDFETFHGGTYEDPITKKMRQFDLRAKLKFHDYVLRFSIECKSLNDYFPLHICRLPRQELEAFHEIVYSYKSIPRSFQSSIGFNYQSIRLNNDYSIYKKNDKVGKSITQIGRDNTGILINGDSDLFDKWSQAINSGFDLVSQSKNDYELNHDQDTFSIIIPILIINDNTLWVTDYSFDGIMQGDPYKVNSCELYLDKYLFTGSFGIGYTFSHLQIFTKTGFIEYIKNFNSDNPYWAKLFPIKYIRTII